MGRDGPDDASHKPQCNNWPATRIAREHAANGGAVIFVGHRLEEVREAADRVVVLRNGRLVADMPVAEATDDRLIKEMVGKEHLATVTADHSGLARPAPVFTMAAAFFT